MSCNRDLNGDDYVETKSTQSGSMRYFFDDPKNAVFFERVLDAESVYGERAEEILKKAKSKMQDEFMDENVLKKAKKTYADRLRRYRKIAADGGQQKFQDKVIQHYEVVPNSIFVNYKPSDGQSSVKHSHLRVVQNSIALGILKKLRNVSFPDIPNLLEERLQYLIDQKALTLSLDDASEVAEHYGYFLERYHQSSNEGDYELIDSDRTTFIESTDAVLKLSEQIKTTGRAGSMRKAPQRG